MGERLMSEATTGLQPHPQNKTHWERDENVEEDNVTPGGQGTKL